MPRLFRSRRSRRPHVSRKLFPASSLLREHTDSNIILFISIRFGFTALQSDHVIPQVDEHTRKR